MAKKRVQNAMVKALLKKVLIMNRDAQRAAAVGSYLMITTMRK
jgi:type IV secretory pathway VirD2 relaxase